MVDTGLPSIHRGFEPAMRLTVSLAPSFLRRFTSIGFVSDMCEKGLSDMVKYLFT